MSTLIDFSVYYSDGGYLSTSNAFERLKVVKTVTHEGERFEGVLYNTAGSRSSLFSVGDEVTIFHDIVNPPTNQVFLGRIDNVDFESEPNLEKVRIGGRDYTACLMDTMVRAVYVSGTSTVCEVGSIVRDLVWRTPYSGTIGVAQVSGTTKIVNSFRVKNSTVYESIKQLAEFVEYDFWIDYTKNLNFRPASNTSTGFTLDNTNSVMAGVTVDALDMANQVTVYGGRQLIGRQESFTGDGVGSVYTLAYGPHNTLVTVSGALKQGGVFEQTAFLPTGAQYLVDFDNRNVIFISGTDVGNNIVGSLVNIVVEYQRSVPIIKRAKNDVSIANNYFKETVITNAEITDPQQAKDVAQSELARMSEPAQQIDIDINSSTISGIQPSQTVVVNLPNDNVSGGQYKVFETVYDISKKNLLNNDTIRVRCGNRVKEMSDILQDIIVKQRQIEALETDPSDTLTELNGFTGSVGLRSHWYIRTRTGLGSSYVLNYVGDAVQSLGMLGSPVSAFGGLVQPFLGDSRNALTVIESGGNWSF